MEIQFLSLQFPSAEIACPKLCIRKDKANHDASVFRVKSFRNKLPLKKKERELGKIFTMILLE